jgi:hypothetical protein
MSMQKLNPNTIANQLEDAHQRTMALIDGLSAAQLMGRLYFALGVQAKIYLKQRKRLKQLPF